jgi:hypothetical protein
MLVSHRFGKRPVKINANPTSTAVARLIFKFIINRMRMCHPVMIACILRQP